MDVIYLASCAVNGTVPETARVDSMDVDAVYVFAGRHMIGAAVAFALESAGYQDQRSSGIIAAAVRKTALFDQAWAEIRQRLEAAGIWYMPLKGAVLKALYPRYGMREFADHDILFDPSRAEDVRAIMEQLGYTSRHYGAGVHDCYYKRPCLNFEMHRALFGASHDEKLTAWFQGVESRLLRDGEWARRFTSEDFYLYFVAHAYKHYAAGGTGLRTLLDAYVYLGKTALDTDYVAAQADKLGIADFERQSRSLALRLFGGGELAEEDRDMLDYILSSGVYGTLHHRVENEMRKKGWGKLRYMLERFRVPISRKNKRYEAMARVYPFFYRHRILLPLLPIYRLLRAARKGKLMAEVKAVKDA